MTVPSPKLSPLQLELLKIFSFNPSEEEMVEVKSMLARYFAKRLTDKVAEAAKEKQITNEDLDQWLNEEGQ